ncbi:hypothetical protein KAFR_0G03730 [Kazachstania africana CBS 2517]|uniref:Uncharacterized protein n=1 Tax=Kazachstania africana (strain ATCC 22294 / BCRC 22015 / CBS 2517 / CECT 1963 / NBRC 1671 / NRRL Y-8276) TaxID=1071382 RepID=H2AYF6_KAZAF|nr:hypothetical protein KAFR_0G03730 [Kazachstania africana CBS 2517]CCF59406.1 hypothetical protein KAFR_0G03730 [Kazachstania africana CBS 2517]
MRYVFFDTKEQSVPIGYITPKFPSLYWPIGFDESFDNAFLYSVVDIWKFTLYWSLIFNGAFYVSAGAVACLTTKKKSRSLLIFATYTVFGGLQGVIVGTVMGFLVGTIYRAGLFGMSCWIPMCCAVAQILYDVLVSYSTVGRIM